MCDEYLQDGLCIQRRCPKRHPRHCRYWSSKPEGCNRNEECQYLHLASKRFSDRSLFTVYEDDNEDESDSCDPCDIDLSDNHEEDTHIEATGSKTQYQESYDVWKVDNGQIHFTCKICETTFASQKAVKQHNMAKHGGRLLSDKNSLLY